MWLEAMDYAVRLPRGPKWVKIDQLMTQAFKLGWDGHRPFKDLALELKPKIDLILQDAPPAPPRQRYGQCPYLSSSP